MVVMVVVREMISQEQLKNNKMATIPEIENLAKIAIDGIVSGKYEEEIITKIYNDLSLFDGCNFAIVIQTKYPYFKNLAYEACYFIR